MRLRADGCASELYTVGLFFCTVCVLVQGASRLGMPYWYSLLVRDLRFESGTLDAQGSGLWHWIAQMHGFLVWPVGANT